MQSSAPSTSGASGEFIDYTTSMTTHFDLLLYVWATTAWSTLTEMEHFIGNLLVRIYLIIEMILADRPCAMPV